MDSARPHEEAESPGGARTRDFALEVALAAFLCFVPAFGAGFVYDDLLLVRDNPYVHGLRYLPRAFTSFFWEASTEGLHYYRPLVTASYAVDWLLSSGRPSLFHVTNVVAHAAATYLVVILARRWTRTPALAAAVGLLFAVHPSRTESVVWIAGRTDVFMTFFALLSVELTYRSVEAPARGRGVALGALGVGALVVALLCKEVAVLTPLLLVCDALSEEDARRRRSRWRALLLPTAIAGAYLAVRVLFAPVRPNGAFEPTPAYGLLTTFAYVERVLWPWPQTFFHRPLSMTGGRFVYPAPLVAGGALVVVAYAALLVATARKKKWVPLVLFVAAAAALGPLLNFSYTGLFFTTSDHFLYLPLFLFLAGVATAQAGPLSRLSRDRRVVAAFLALLFLYAGIDAARALEYRNQTTLFEAERRVAPDNPIALKSLAEVRAQEGDLSAARDLLAAASRPESTRFALLMPAWLDLRDYFRLLGLEAALTADGDVRDLERLHAELEAQLDGAPSPFTGQVGPIAVGRHPSQSDRKRALDPDTRAMVAVEAALVGTRLGHDERARARLASLDEERAVEKLPDARNLALARARLEDFAGARRVLGRLGRRAPSRFPEGALAPEQGRFDRAEDLFRRAREARGERGKRRLRAEAFVELGATLRALRELRPVYEAAPHDAELGPLYVQLLVAAGLVHEARDIATRELGRERGGAFVAGIESSLPERLRNLRRPEEPVDWAGTP